MSTPTAILASGSGTTAETFIRAAVAKEVDADVRLVITNKADAGILARIEALNEELSLAIETVVIGAKTHPAAENEAVTPGGQTVAEETAILAALKKAGIELVLLLGYLRRVGPRIVEAYGWQTGYESPYQARMLNTHPGLLPATKGLWGVYVQEHVVTNGLPEGGHTLHVVAEEYDDGPLIAEHSVLVEPGDTAATFFERVKTAEKYHLPADVQAFILGREQYLQQR